MARRECITSKNLFQGVYVLEVDWQVSLGLSFVRCATHLSPSLTHTHEVDTLSRNVRSCDQHLIPLREPAVCKSLTSNNHLFSSDEIFLQPLLHTVSITCFKHELEHMEPSRLPGFHRELSPGTGRGKLYNFIERNKRANSLS